MIAQPQLTLLRRIAEQAKVSDCDVALGWNVVLALVEAVEEGQAYRAYWEPKVKELSDLHVRQGGKLAIVRTLIDTLYKSAGDYGDEPEVSVSGAKLRHLWMAAMEKVVEDAHRR